MANYPYYNNPYAYQSPQPSSSIIWVAGEKEAALYPVAPNNAVALWDSEGSTVYMKQTDASGRASLKIYDLIEREPAGTEKEEYATRADVAGLLKTLEGMKSDIEKLKKKKKGEEDE